MKRTRLIGMIAALGMASVLALPVLQAQDAAPSAPNPDSTTSAQALISRTACGKGTSSTPARPRMTTAAKAQITTATALALAGSFGFFGIHAVSIIDYAAIDQPDRAAMVALIESAQNSTLALLILIPFLLGMAGSVLLISIGYLRTRVVPLWIPVVFLVFLVLDFGPFPTGPIDPHWLFVAASFGVAYVIAKRTDRQWWTGRTPDEATS